jgi:hypothetical protein
LINHKTVFGTRNPAFWVGAVMPSLFFFGRGLSVHFGLFWCGCLVALLDFFSVGLCVEKNANVPPNALALKWQS